MDDPNTYHGSATPALVDLHRAGWSVRAIARQLDVSTQHVYRTLARWGLTPNGPRP